MTREEQLREVEEAIFAGQRAYQAICEVESHLSSARGFGIWDMLGGGFVSGLLKHSQMDDAQRCVNQASMELQRFQKELSDLNMSLNSFGVQFDGVTKFLDICFDNFLVDALVQSRIRQTQQNLSNVKLQVQNTLNQLQNMRNSL